MNKSCMSVLCSLLFLISSNVAVAQFKTGQNPRVLNPSLYFEVEAQSGNRFAVTKSDASTGIGTSAPNAKAQLEVTSTTKGILVPRMTTAQRLAITSPPNGLLVYDTTTNSFWVTQGATWTKMISGAPSISTKTSNYTLQANDNGSIIEFNTAGAVTLTIPTGLPVGMQVSITQLGAGQVSFVGSGVTVVNPYNFNKTAKQYSKAGIEMASTGVAILSGDVK